MALGKYTRVDGKRSSSYCSTGVVVALVALCLVGLWMMTSTSVVPVEDVAELSQDGKADVKKPVTETQTRQFDDSQDDLPDNAMNGDTNTNSSQEERNSDVQENQKVSEETTEKTSEEKSEKETKNNPTPSDDTSNIETETNASETKTKDKESNSESGETKTKEEETNSGVQSVSQESSNETKKDEKVDGQTEKKVEKNQDEQSESPKKEDESKNQGQKEVFPDGSQSELLNETTTQSEGWSTQAAESSNEKEVQKSSGGNDGGVSSAYSWRVCNVTAGADYIPCLDNVKAIKKLRSTKHYEHRERHCPEQGPTCLVSLPEGYKRSVEWPKSREKIWYHNVPHPMLAEVKGHQNWVKVTGEYLTFPGGGTQFKNGALHYLDFLEQAVPDIAWGKQSRVVLDVGCGVASLGGYLFDKDVLTMSFAPKDEHEAQVQFALERGIPAISAVMGTTRLPFPSRVFDVVHCARCRVPWHIEGGKLLLELNRMLRPGGYFVWSATPVYQKLEEDVEIWDAMTELTKKMCWERLTIQKDAVNEVGAAICRKPSSNECYEKRPENEPPLCKQSDDPNAAWYVPLQACIHKIPVE